MDSLVSAPVAASGDFSADAARFSAYWRDAKQQLARLPAKPKRDTAAHDAAEALKQAARDARFAFLRRHARTLYDRLTDGRRKFVRVEQLVYDAAELVPGLAPTCAEVLAEAELRQSEKDGCEIDQGILCNQFLADAQCGLHLCHAMLLPREESAEALAKFLRDGRLDLGFARVERQGKAAVLLLSNRRFLNSEDASTQPATEIGADVCILDPHSQVAVLRGDVVPEGKYAGRRVYNAGINLTHLYYGKIPFLWFLVRDLGFVNKIFRGLAKPEVPPDEVAGDSIEKLWISAVETFAIGGGCQILLASDFNIAARDAYMTLPARKEGIIPAMANLRMARFTGDRRALRLSAEPLDLFRQYAALYAREQAYCHFSPALISNLELFWNAQNRKA